MIIVLKQEEADITARRIMDDSTLTMAEKVELLKELEKFTD